MAIAAAAVIDGHGARALMDRVRHETILLPLEILTGPGARERAVNGMRKTLILLGKPPDELHTASLFNISVFASKSIGRAVEADSDPPAA